MIPKFNKLPSLASFQAFEAAARLGNFTAAAQELNSTQSAVSQKIRKLEDEIQLTLFRRENRGASMTPAAEKLLESVNEGIKILSDGVASAQQIEQHISINVATDYAFAAFWILPRLSRFRENYPNVEVSVNTSDHFSPNDKSTDIAIVFGNDQYNHYQTQFLFNEQVRIVCSPALLTNQKKLVADKIPQLPLLELSTQAPKRYFSWRTVFESLALDCAPKEPDMRFNNYTLLLQAAIAGQGLAIGWIPLIDSLLANNLLVPVIDKTLTSNQGYHLLLPNNQSINPMVQAFADWIIEESAIEESVLQNSAMQNN